MRHSVKGALVRAVDRPYAESYVVVHVNVRALVRETADSGQANIGINSYILDMICGRGPLMREE